jgi:hypothetical protein
MKKKIESKEKIISKLNRAKNLYCQAGDEKNTKKQYISLMDDARKAVNDAILLIEEL